MSHWPSCWQIVAPGQTSVGCWLIVVFVTALGSRPSGGDCIGYFWTFSDGIGVLTEYSTSFNRSLGPARFVGRNDEFEEHRSELNTVLALAGLEYGADGKFRNRPAAATLTEAERRVKTIQAKFQGRRIHAEVLKYCKAELMQDNSFHAVLEATKGLAQRIREMTGVDGDGAALVDRVFSTSQPVLAFNTLQTETEKSEHTGFATLLKGCFAALRNPRAHRPRILWKDEDDTIDYFTLISLLHRKLDDCVLTGMRGPR